MCRRATKPYHDRTVDLLHAMLSLHHDLEQAKTPDERTGLQRDIATINLGVEAPHAAW